MAVGLADPAQDWRSRFSRRRTRRNECRGSTRALAPVYEAWARATESKARRRVLELAGVRPGEDVLEVATGTGVQLVRLARPTPADAPSA